MKRQLLAVIIVSMIPCVSAVAQSADSSTQVDDSVAQALSIISPGSPPFHMRVETVTSYGNDTSYTSEIEEWWAAPNQWRRVLKSPHFSQTAVRNGDRYSETNSADFMPWWISNLLTELVDPLPLDVLHQAENDAGGEQLGNGCKSFQLHTSNGTDNDVMGEQLCFNPDGSVRTVFVHPANGDFSNYKLFGDKQVARHIETYEGHDTIEANVTLLEPLTPDASLFVVDHDTGYTSRLRFVRVPEVAMRGAIASAPDVVFAATSNHFPATGLTLIGVSVDRAGNVRSTERIITDSPDVDANAASQVMNWKFKPWIVDGATVEVNTTLTLRWNTKVQIAGYPADAPSQPASKWFAGARRANTMREDDGKPFHLRAKIAPCDSGDSGGAAIEGSYEELWESPERWRIEIDAGNVQAIEAREDDQFYRQLRGADLMPVCVAEALGLLYDPVPAADEIYEADWTQDVAVVDGDPVVRVRRGPLNPDGTLPLNTYAFWFDPKTGSLRGYQSTAYGTPSMTEYGNYIAWQGKEVPGRVDLLENGKQVLEATVEKIEDLGSVSDSTFDIPGVQPERMRDTDAYEGAVSVPVRVIRQAGAANSPPGHGVVLLAVNVDRTGRVTGSTVLRSAGLLLDVAAQQAAMKWVFAPAILDGKPASTMVRIQIEF